MYKLSAGLLAVVFSASAPAATIVLYDQNFEAPVGYVNDGGDVNSARTVNQLYGGQPPGFSFAQTFTVETLRVGGNSAWGGSGFVDPQARAGSYVLGLLSTVQDDRLGLAFNVGSNPFLNFRLDISSIDLNTFAGPFVPTGGAAPVFRFTLFDNPSGAVSIGGGPVLATAEATGLVAPNKFTFNWREVTVALNAAGNTNGNVILQIDLLGGGYAAMDNFRIAASDVPGDVGTPTPSVPEPATLLLLGAGLLGIGAARRRTTA